MTDSPFRRIILPALLAASAGFAALTWPLASEHHGRVSDGLPEPIRYWVDSALIPHQHKDVSIRYIGFAILSSVAIGIGTAEAIRIHQAQASDRQRRLATALPASPVSMESPLPLDELALAGAPGRALPVGGLTEARPGDALDWGNLAAPAPRPGEVDSAAAGLLSAPTADYPLVHLRLPDQENCLALVCDGEYYRYYRNRPSAAKARSLVQYLRQRGQTAITTWDNGSYVVWVHHPGTPPARPWPEKLGVSAQ